MKKYWDSNFPGGQYDAVARRKGLTPVIFEPSLANVTSSKPVRSASAGMVSALPRSPKGAVRVASTASIAHAPGTPSTLSNLQQSITNMNRSLTEMRMSLEDMEKERDFYFGKLRDVEAVTQRYTDPAVTATSFFKEIIEALYKTEEGFEIPEETVMENTN